MEVQIFKGKTLDRWNTLVEGTLVVSGSNYLIAVLEDIHNDRDNNLILVQKDTLEFIRMEKI